MLSSSANKQQSIFLVVLGVPQRIFIEAHRHLESNFFFFFIYFLAACRSLVEGLAGIGESLGKVVWNFSSFHQISYNGQQYPRLHGNNQQSSEKKLGPLHTKIIIR